MTPRHAATTPRSTAAGGFRPDIQGLRAIAVGLVVVYHLYPNRLPGGFVGVDVFFVISGYLITGHLARGFDDRGAVPLLDFWGRRARRLLPAATIVLVVTWLLSRWLLPVTQLPAAADQVRASALYFQNWVLAHDSVDYLAHENAASPVQHFWSLSVEEQFYVVWPLLFVLAAGVARLVRSSCDGDVRRIRRGFVLATAGTVFAASFAYSIVDTANDPAAAYFVTPTRMWELALGGIVALLPTAAVRMSGRLGVLAWIGLAAVLGTAVWLDGATPFPGSIAMVPVAGTALVLLCGGRAGRLGPSWLTSTRPFVFFGDISYALYLWHWPLIVLWLAYSGGRIGRVDGPLVLVAAVVLAWLTKLVVEDPVRRWPLLRRRPVYSLALVATVLVPVVIVGLTRPVTPRFDGSVDAQHPGGAALLGAATPVADPVPPFAAIPADLPFTSTRDVCQSNPDETAVTQCFFGDTVAPTRTVALVGDSHAGQWSSALDRIGKQRHWKFVAVLHSGCPFTSTMTLREGKRFTACRVWGAAALRALVTTIEPDTVILSDRADLGTPANPTPGRASWNQIARGVADYASQLDARGISTVAIRETPEMADSVPDCLSRRGAVPADCDRKRTHAIAEGTPMVAAHAHVGAALPLVDMNDLICGPRACDGVVGNVIVYRDSHHLTRTYTLSVAPYLVDRLVRSGAFD